MTVFEAHGSVAGRQVSIEDEQPLCPEVLDVVSEWILRAAAAARQGGVS